MNWILNLLSVWQLLTTDYFFFTSISIFFCKTMCQVSDLQILSGLNFSKHLSFTSTTFVMYLHTKVHIFGTWKRRRIARSWSFPVIGSIHVLHVENTWKAHVWVEKRLLVCCLVYTVSLYLNVYVYIAWRSINQKCYLSQGETLDQNVRNSKLNVQIVISF
jgi:hypothetical protein